MLGQEVVRSYPEAHHIDAALGVGGRYVGRGSLRLGKPENVRVYFESVQSTSGPADSVNLGNG
jgi:hypothetical protein